MPGPQGHSPRQVTETVSVGGLKSLCIRTRVNPLKAGQANVVGLLKGLDVGTALTNEDGPWLAALHAIDGGFMQA